MSADTLKPITEVAEDMMPTCFESVASSYRRGIQDAKLGVFDAPRSCRNEFDAYCYGAATYNALKAQG